MDRLFRLFLTVVICLGLIGCSAAVSNPSSDNGGTTTTTKRTYTTKKKTTTTKKPTTQPPRVLTMTEQLSGLFDGTVRESLDKSCGGGFSMHFPDMVWVGDTIYAYYISYPAGAAGPCIGLATSTDGVKFTKVTDSIILAGPEDFDAQMASFPGIWVEDGIFYLVYEAKPANGNADIALATSTDGINFEKQGVILYKDSTSKWQDINIGTPDLFKKDGIWYLTFHGYGTDGWDCQIGLATGTELALGKLTVHPGPIIPTSSNPEDPDSGTTGRRDVIYDENSGYFYMVYEISTDAVGELGYDGAYWNHAFGRSRDMIHWETVGPLIERKTTGFGYDGTNFLIMDGQVYVYMRNLLNGTTRILLLAK